MVASFHRNKRMMKILGYITIHEGNVSELHMSVAKDMCKKSGWDLVTGSVDGTSSMNSWVYPRLNVCKRNDTGNNVDKK